MRRLPLLLSLALFGSASAQSNPDFSGSWERADSPEQPSIAASGDAKFVSGDMGSGWGSALTIRQAPNSLAIEDAHFSTYDMQPPLRRVYALDGTDSVNSIMIGHAESTQHSHAAWRGQTLLISTQVPVPGSDIRVEVQQALTLESSQTLVIETTRSGISGTAPTVTRTRYVRR
ncbi:MAG TPA: hypothetical protein VJS12_18935 [Steroidobacteraceae bacterium]|nr:hypothetical protein [Steroidobacteraceae bacterium]